MLIKADENSFSRLIKQGDDFIWHDYEDLEAHATRVTRQQLEGLVRTKDGDHKQCEIPLSKLGEWGAKFGLTWRQVADDDKLLDRFLDEHPVYDYRKHLTEKYFNGV
jgi:hypothetical protein